MSSVLEIKELGTGHWAAEGWTLGPPTHSLTHPHPRPFIHRWTHSPWGKAGFRPCGGSRFEARQGPHGPWPLSRPVSGGPV